MQQVNILVSTTLHMRSFWWGQKRVQVHALRVHGTVCFQLGATRLGHNVIHPLDESSWKLQDGVVQIKSFVARACGREHLRVHVDAALRRVSGSCSHPHCFCVDPDRLGHFVCLDLSNNTRASVLVSSVRICAGFAFRSCFVLFGALICMNGFLFGVAFRCTE